MKLKAHNFSSTTGPSNMPKTALNLSDELTRVHRPQKISLNWILKESQKFDFWTHLGSGLQEVWKVPKFGGPKSGNFQKYRGTVRESSLKLIIIYLICRLWLITGWGTILQPFGHLHMTYQPKISLKWLNEPFWANFENSRFLTIFEVSYGPKQWRYQVFSAEFVFSAVF